MIYKPVSVLHRSWYRRRHVNQLIMSGCLPGNAASLVKGMPVDDVIEARGYKMRIQKDYMSDQLSEALRHCKNEQ